jgi:hypothetical protein
MLKRRAARTRRPIKGVVAAIKDGRRRARARSPELNINPIKTPTARAQVARSRLKNNRKFVKKLE